jgi:hypothetical protein
VTFKEMKKNDAQIAPFILLMIIVILFDDNCM